MNGNLKKEVSPAFWPDAVACWHRLPNKTFFFGLLAAWLVLFQFHGNSLLGYIHTESIFAWLNEAYNRDPASDDGHGNLIPFVVIGLFWWKRKELLALKLETWWPAIFIVALAAVIHTAGYVVQQPRFSVMAMLLGIFGLMGMAWGKAWLKAGFFPFWLFIFSVPLSAWTLPLTFPLRLLASWLTATVASLLTIPVVRVGTQLMAPDGSFQYDVVAACSGMRSLVAIFLLATVCGFVMFRSPKKRLFLMALALPLSVLGNFTRLMCIIIASEFGGQKWGNYVHEGCPFHLPILGEIALANLIPYIPAIVGLIWIGRMLGKNDEAKPAPTPETKPEIK